MKETPQKAKMLVEPWSHTAARKIKTIFCDTDGTLSDVPDRQWGKPRADVIAALARAKAKGWKIVLWSGNGEKYVRQFAKKHGIPHHLCLDKPSIAVDDKEMIRPLYKGWLMTPEEFLKWAK